MARTKAEKQDIIEKVKKIADDSQSIVFVNFHGLKVSGATEVRRKLKSEDIGFFVAKKTIMSKAFENLKSKKITGSMPVLDGEVGIAYGKDLVAPAREVFAFQNKFKVGKDGKGGGIVILGGIFEGKYMTKEEMLDIALIPSLTALRSMFVNVINSPIQGFVVALDQIAQKKQTI
jgi:large subunit ribosomal protein L10